MTSGFSLTGGDSAAVQDVLQNVQQIQATKGAFAAIGGDGSVMTWGHAGFGGDSSAVQAQLKTVRQIQATLSAFAAILWRQRCCAERAKECAADPSHFSRFRRYCY